MAAVKELPKIRACRVFAYIFILLIKTRLHAFSNSPKLEKSKMKKIVFKMVIFRHETQKKYFPKKKALNYEVFL